MAYMIKDKGPYPNKAGEYCGNHYLDSRFHPPCISNETLAQAKKREDEWLSKMRFGRPQPTAEYTTKQFEEMGLAGLYLKENRPLLSHETPCATPPELLEPPETN